MPDAITISPKLILWALLLTACGCAEDPTASSQTPETDNTAQVPVRPLPPVRVSHRQTITNSLGMQFVRISPGQFSMGSPRTEAGRWDDELQHTVRITRPFYLNAHEVTVGQFRQFVKATGYVTSAEADGIGGLGFDVQPASVTARYDQQYNWQNPGFEQTEHHPVVNVAWTDAVEFTKWLSRRESAKYRLPTEAEWEYACCAGHQSVYQTGTVARSIVSVANVADLDLRDRGVFSRHVGQLFVDARDGFVFTAPVGRLQPNGFGAFDMIGNVSEWCADWYQPRYENSVSPVINPSGPTTGERRCFRGGNWGSDGRFVRTASRAREEPNYRSAYVGFRVVREISDTLPAHDDLHTEDRQQTPSGNSGASLETRPGKHPRRSGSTPEGQETAPASVGDRPHSAPSTAADDKTERPQNRFLPAGTKPNVLVIMTDYWYQNEHSVQDVDMPAFEFLKSNGAFFRNAFAATTVPLAAQATILTGRWPWQLEDAASYRGQLAGHIRSYQQILADSGYLTVRSGTLWGPDHARLPAGQRMADMHSLDRYTRHATSVCVLTGRPQQAAYKKGVAPALAGLSVDVPPHLPNAPVVRNDAGLSVYTLRYFDRYLRKTLDGLTKRSHLDNTVIIVTSMFGSALPRGAGNHYDYGTHVPLVIYWPGVIQPGTVVDEFVSLIDLAPTICDIAGVTVPVEFSGQSLIPLLNGRDTTDRTFVLHGRERYLPAQAAPDRGGYPVRAIRTKDFLYIHNFRPDRWPSGTPDKSASLLNRALADCVNRPTRDYLIANADSDAKARRAYRLAFAKRPADELYDLKNDPYQLVNVAARPAFADTTARLRARLFAELKAGGDPRVTGRGTDFDAVPFPGLPPLSSAASAAAAP